MEGHPIDKIYVLKYILFPSGVDAVLILLTTFIIVSKKFSDRFKNFAIITFLEAIAFVLSIAHNYFMIVPAAFLAPVVSTIVFLDKKLTIYSIIASICLTWITVPISVVFDSNFNMLERLLNNIIAMVLILLFYIIARMIIEINLERERVLIELSDDNERLVREAHYDGLTGVMNHTSFYRELNKEILLAKESRLPFCVSMIDVDDFKKVNDLCGHDKGDDVLQAVSKIFVDRTEKFGTVFRYGGDEFAIIFTGCTKNDALHQLNKACEEIRKTDFNISGQKISVSVGLYEVSEFDLTDEEIFSITDKILYNAKNSGKNRVHFS